MGTARMTMTQMNYAKERLQTAYNDLLGPAPDDQEVKNLNMKERANLVRSGKVKIGPALIKRALARFDAQVDKVSWPNDIYQMLDSEIQKEIARKHRPINVAVTTKFEARRKKLDAKFIKVQDELILGDAGLALTLIESFRQTKV